jgi:hypothetical protein
MRGLIAKSRDIGCICVSKHVQRRKVLTSETIRGVEDDRSRNLFRKIVPAKWIIYDKCSWSDKQLKLRP